MTEIFTIKNPPSFQRLADVLQCQQRRKEGIFIFIPQNSPEGIWDFREFLYPGDILNTREGTFRIHRPLRRGGTYICYQASREAVPGMLKELYPGYFFSPAITQCLMLQRQRNHRLSGSNFVIQNRFESICRDYGRCYRAIPPDFPMESVFLTENGGLWVWTPYRDDLISYRTFLRRIKENSHEPLIEILGSIRDLTDSVRRLHRAGLLHLDISPETVCIDSEGKLILQDFDGIHPIGGSCIPIGGVGFSRAPEVTRGRAENRSDIYSIGAVLFAALFDSEVIDPDQIGHLITASPLHCAAGPNPHEFLRCMLVKILQKCLAPRPKDRYSCCEELIGDLDRLIAEFPPETGENDVLYTINTTE